MGIRIKHSGDFKKISKQLNKLSKFDAKALLNKYGDIGCGYLSDETPFDTGLTSELWDFEVIKYKQGQEVINWFNDNEINGFNVALGLEYGYGTRQGGYVPGTDYINPALKAVCDEFIDELWEEVTDK